MDALDPSSFGLHVLHTQHPNGDPIVPIPTPAFKKAGCRAGFDSPYRINEGKIRTVASGLTFCRIRLNHRPMIQLEAFEATV